MAKRGLFAELKRRNVLRAAAVYIAAVWALAQGIAQLAPAFGAPDWVTRWFVVACAIGFPFWVAFAWYYEWTPHGLKRESEVDPAVSITRRTGRKLDYWIFGIMALAIVLLVTNQFVSRRDATSVAEGLGANTVAAKLATVPERSVAVLPFANESGDPKQAYFSDGVSEELISDLTQIGSLKVIGKYSSFQFRDSKDTLAQIGAALGVAYLVEGSVHQAGDELRITVDLIRARDGSSVWSKAYQRPLTDLFAIQSEIGKAVADALRIKLVGGTLVDQQKPPGGSVGAYQLMLQGRAQAQRATQADFEQGIALLEHAVQIDPDYAYAWALLANVRVGLGTVFLGGEARQQTLAKAREDLDRATALAPDAAFVHQQLAYLLGRVDNDQPGAIKEAQRALALVPNDGVSMAYLAWALAETGQPQQAVDLYRKALITDPLRAGWYNNLCGILIQLGRFGEAEQAARKAVALQPGNPRNYIILSGIVGASGKFDAAEQAARKAEALQPDDPQNQLTLATILDLRGRTAESLRALRKAQALQPDYPGVHMALAVYAIRHGDAATALREAGKETDPGRREWAVALAKQAGGDRVAADAALKDYLDKHAGSQPDYSNIADLYAVRKQPDPMFEWLERGVAARDMGMIGNLLTDSLLIPYHHEPRFAALCRQLGLPVPGETPPAPSAL